LFVNVLTYVFAARESDDASAHIVCGCDLQPAGSTSPRSGLKCALDVDIRAAPLVYCNFIADLDLEAGDVDFAAIDLYVAVTDKLARLRSAGSIAEAIDDIVETAFKQREKIFARHALHTHGALEVEPELALQHAVYTFYLLLFAQLLAVSYELRSANVAAMLTRRLGAAFFNRAARLVASLALQKQLHSFPAAQTAHRTTVSCQFSSSI
jgi:hypothetical protein